MAKDEGDMMFIPGLPNTPGWVALNQAEKDWVQQATSDVNASFRSAGLSTLKGILGLMSLRSYLEGKPLTMTNWLRTSFPGSERGGRRWLELGDKLADYAPQDALLMLAEKGVANLGNLQTGHLLPVIKENPPPKDKKKYSEWIDVVGEKVKETYRERRKGRHPKLTEDGALKNFVQTGVRLLKEAKLGTSAEQRGFLKRGVGMVMEKRAITGTVSTERVPIPEGFFPPRGRPKKIKKAA